jgi:hypothetical protein
MYFSAKLPPYQLFNAEIVANTAEAERIKIYFP